MRSLPGVVLATLSLAFLAVPVLRVRVARRRRLRGFDRRLARDLETVTIYKDHGVAPKRQSM
jgi:Flp pilus assembly protein TadB